MVGRKCNDPVMTIPLALPNPLSRPNGRAKLSGEALKDQGSVKNLRFPMDDRFLRLLVLPLGHPVGGGNGVPSAVVYCT